MGFIQTPSLVVLPGRKNGERQYAASFSYDFLNDPINPISAGGFVSTGSSVDFNSLNLGPAAVNLPPFKSMQFTASFEGSGASPYVVPGQLFVVVQGTGQIISIVPEMVVESTTIGTYISTVSGCIPIVANSPTNIQFLKTIDSAPVSLPSGKLQATFFTFDLPAYISQGQVLFQ